MTTKNTNLVLGARGRYLEAQRRAAEKDAAKAERVAKRAEARTLSVQSDASAPAQPSSLPVQQNVAPKSAQEAKPKWCICHPPGTYPHESFGLCKKSVDSLRFTRPPKLPADVTGIYRERAELVAWKVRPAKTKYELTQAKMSDPDVANFVATNVIRKGMDYAEGVAAALPELKDSPTELGPAINAAKQSPMVQQAINDSLKKKGLDQNSKEFFVDQLWKWFLSTNPSEERRQLQAARILSEAFIKGQPPTGENAVLRIEGIDEGLSEMGLTPDVLKDLKPVTTDVAVEDFEEDPEGLPS